MNNVAKSAIVAAFIFFSAIVSAASRNSADLLQYIPADTPYVFVSTKPMPKKLAEKVEPVVDDLMKAYQTVIRHAMEDKFEEMSAEGENPEDVAALMDEILGLMSLDGIRGAGIARDSAFAFYGNGLMPVLRFELSDERLFDDAIARIEEKAKSALLSDTTKGEEYKYFDLGNVRAVIATIDDQAIVTVVPSQITEAQTAAYLGIDKPRSNIKKSGSLKAIQKKYGFTEHMIGLIDANRIASIFTGNATANDLELFAAFDTDLPEMSDVCAAETRDLVAIAPRMVFGYDKVTAKNLDSSMIIEMRDDIAKGLSTLPAVVPGLGVDPGGFMSFGLSTDPLKAREFYEARVSAMEEDPFKCEHFAAFQAGATKGREVLSQPLPPVVYNFRGFVANITDVQGMDLSNDQPPESIDGSLLLAVNDAEALLMMGAMMDPAIAALNLLPDGNAKKLELEKLGEFAEEAFAALSKNALSIAIGSNAESVSENVLDAKSAKPAPFMSMSMDAARYYAILGEAMMQDKSDEEGEQTPLAMREALRDIMTLSGSLYERIVFGVHFTERGVEIGGKMTLAK